MRHDQAVFDTPEVLSAHPETQKCRPEGAAFCIEH
jgi:hypothetical protein